jgi:hypothetical protein
MHSVVENYHGSNEKIVKFVRSHDEFILFVQSTLGDEEVTKLDGLIDSILDHSFVRGKYLVSNANVLSLVEKKEVISYGRLYNSTTHELEVSQTWKLIPNDVPFPSPTQIPTSKPEFDLNSIPTFDLSTLTANSKITIIARARSQRSNLIKCILENFDNKFIHNTLVVCPTMETDPVYMTQLPAKFDNSFDHKYLDQMDQNYNAIVLDNCLPPIFPGPLYLSMINLFINDKVSIATDQFPYEDIMTLPTDYYFIFRDDLFTFQKKLYRALESIFPSFVVLKECLTKLTDNYDCLVIKKYSTSPNWYDKISYFKAI